MSSRYSIEGVILKSLNYKDTDKIFTVYTKTKGKITATAKGVRKVSSRRGGNLDTLNYVVLGINESTKGYKYISEVKSKKTFRALKENLDKATSSFYIVELIHKLTEEEQQNERVFDLLLKVLKLLEDDRVNDTYAVNFFEVNLMKFLGYEVSFHKCVSCEKPFSSDWSSCSINFNLGGLICDECSQQGFKLSLEEAAYLSKISRGKIPASNIDTAHVNDLLKMYIRNILDSDMKSVSYFKS